MPIIIDMTIYSLLISVVPDILIVILICFFFNFQADNGCIRHAQNLDFIKHLISWTNPLLVSL